MPSTLPQGRPDEAEWLLGLLLQDTYPALEVSCCVSLCSCPSFVPCGPAGISARRTTINRAAWRASVLADPVLFDLRVQQPPVDPQNLGRLASILMGLMQGFHDHLALNFREHVLHGYFLAHLLL